MELRVAGQWGNQTEVGIQHIKAQAHNLTIIHCYTSAITILEETHEKDTKIMSIFIFHCYS